MNLDITYSKVMYIVVQYTGNREEQCSKVRIIYRFSCKISQLAAGCPSNKAITRQCTILLCTAQHYCTDLFCTALNFTALQLTELPCTGRLCDSLHCTVSILPS